MLPHISLILLNMRRARAGHIRYMQNDQTIFANRPAESVATATVLLRRSGSTDSVIYIAHGSVLLGILGTGAGTETIEHQLGVVEGPCWLETTAAILNLPGAVDAVAQTPVQLYRLSLAEFDAMLGTCPPEMQSMLHDMARAHRMQTELTVSRLAKDAEARCAEWLLSHAKISDQGDCAVQLQQRKRAIAAHLGIAPETLSRVLRHLREQRLISGSGRVVNLVDPSGLRRLAGPSAPRQCAAA